MTPIVVYIGCARYGRWSPGADVAHHRGSNIILNELAAKRLGFARPPDAIGKVLRLQAGDVARDQRLHQGGDRRVVRLGVAAGSRQPQPGRAHVGDVEQAGVLAGPAVLGQDAFVLNRHVVAAEADHASPGRAVRGVEGSDLQGFVAHSDSRGRVLKRFPAGLAPPLS